MRLALPSLMLAFALSLHAQNQEHCNDYKGKIPPDLKGAKEFWLNVKEPLYLEDLKGLVVWLEFAEIG